MAKLNDLKVSFISLVNRPANKKDIVFKSSNTDKLKYNIMKSIKINKSEPQGLIFGTVYEANKQDTDGDWTDLETIKKAAHEFLANGNNSNVDTDHNGQPSGAVVVESWVDDKAWNIVIKSDPKSALYEKVQKGDYKGISLAGMSKKSDEKCPEATTTSEEIKALKAELEELKKNVKELPGTKQIQFDSAGNVVKNDKTSEDDAYGVFNVLEVNND